MKEEKGRTWHKSDTCKAPEEPAEKNEFLWQGVGLELGRCQAAAAPGARWEVGGGRQETSGLQCTENRNSRAASRQEGANQLVRTDWEEQRNTGKHLFVKRRRG